jgi:hypothetical protein
MYKRLAVYTVALALLGSLGLGPCRADSITYDVTVNTFGLNGLAGNLDFQFNPGAAAALAATATVTNFQTVGGIPAGTSTPTGDASGVLPGTLTLDNGTAFNDLFQGFTYGSNFTFDLTLSGPAVGGTGSSVGSAFALSLLDSTGTLPLLTTDPNGSVLTIKVNPDGSTSVLTFPQAVDSSIHAASASVVGAAVPEPMSLVLLATALPAGLMVRRHMRQQIRLAESQEY